MERALARSAIAVGAALFLVTCGYRHQAYRLDDQSKLADPKFDLQAVAYRRLHRLSMGLSYENTQTPVMLTLSADNDKARHSLFTIGRRVGEFFGGKPGKDDATEREAERKALGVDGEFVKHVTHRMQPVDDRERLMSQELDLGRESVCEEE